MVNLEEKLMRAASAIGATSLGTVVVGRDSGSVVAKVDHKEVFELVLAVKGDTYGKADHPWLGRGH
jgi:hypothetical protein